jgi:Domain of unknown function (DUF4340)
MKLKKEYIILVLIIAVLGVYLVMRNSDRTHYQLPEIADLEQKDITKIEILKNGDSIVLNKKDNQWYLEPAGYLADKDKVKAMLNVFGDLTLTALVSESKDYDRYDLNDEKRITAKAWQQEALKRNFDIGKSAPSFRHTFVRLDGDSRVFHARDNFRGKFDLTSDSLRDKKVLSFKSADIREMQIIKGKTTLKFIRGQVPVKPQQDKSDNTSPTAIKFEWQNSAGEKANDQALNRFLATLGSLKCADYINDRPKDAFSAPIYAVKLIGDRDYRLDIFAKLQTDDQDYPAVSSDSDYPFRLSGSQVQQIMKNATDFLEPKNKAEEKQ